MRRRPEALALALSLGLGAAAVASERAAPPGPLPHVAAPAGEPTAAKDQVELIGEVEPYGRTEVRARVSGVLLAGRAGPALLDVGAAITGPRDVLITIDQPDRVYVSFRPSAEQQRDWARNPRMVRALQPGGTARLQVLLSDGSVLPQEGRIAFVLPAAHPTTAGPKFRARFANHDRRLVPGQRVRVRLRALTPSLAATRVE